VANNSAGASFGADQSFITNNNQSSNSYTAKVDFNNDGQTDILWRHKSTGQLAVWYLNGITFTGSAVIAPTSDTNFELVGTGDFNSDGKMDLLWRNDQNGQIAVWYINGVTPTRSAVIAPSSDTNFEIV
jgi:hypothetical protein